MTPKAGVGGDSASAFEVVEEWEEREVIVHRRSRVVFRTNDGIEANAYVIDNRKWGGKNPVDLRVKGVDPSHTLGDDGRCSACGKPLTNGCYGSQLPCGFDSGGNSLVGIIEHWKQSNRRSGQRQEQEG